MIKPLWRQLGSYVAPMIAGNVLQLVSGTATAALLGRILGTQALAANGVIYPITLLCYSFFTGLSSGATILVARANGAGDDDATKRLIVEAIGVAIGAGAIFALAGIGFAPAILHVLGTPAAVFTDTLHYLQIVSISMLAFLPYMMYGALLRGLGDTKTPFTMLLASTLMTVALTSLLIVGVGPVHSFGVLGAPISSLLAIAIVTVVTATLLPKRHTAFHLPAAGLRALVPGLQTIRDIFSIGVPIATQYIAVSISELVLLSIITAGGATAIAVYAAMNQIIAYVMTPMSMIGIAASAFSAKELGAGRIREIPAIGRTAVLMMLALTGASTVLVFAFATPLLRLFLSSPDALVLARHAVFAMLWSVPVLGIGMVATALARSERRATGPMLANVIGVWLVLLPCAKFLVSHNGIIGVWQAYPVAYIAIAAMEVAYFAHIWRRMEAQTAAA